MTKVYFLFLSGIGYRLRAKQDPNPICEKGKGLSDRETEIKANIQFHFNMRYRMTWSSHYPPPLPQWAELGKFVKSKMFGLFFYCFNFEIFEF